MKVAPLGAEQEERMEVEVDPNVAAQPAALEVQPAAVAAPEVPAAAPAAPNIVEYMGIPPDLGPGSHVDRMRDHLRNRLGGAVYGKKAELWSRIVRLDNERKQQREQEMFMERRREELQQAEVPMAPVLIPGPKAPTEAEREQHSLTHYPPERWCEFCMRGRGKEDPPS